MASPRALRIAYFGYRGWAFAILERLLSGLSHHPSTIAYIGTVPYEEETIAYDRYPSLRVIDPKDGPALNASIEEHRIDLVLFYGWSWFVPDALTKRRDCLCLHPSLLPKYRGGSPIQHQILGAETDGGLTIFRMNDVLDGGDILAQRGFSLGGTLQDIFQRIVEHGADATLDLFRHYEDGTIVYAPQENLDASPPYQRRKPKESELTLSRLQDITQRSFYNFVRALDDPYPNCFFRLSPTEVLEVNEVRILDARPREAPLSAGPTASVGPAPIFALPAGQAALVRYTIREWPEEKK